MFKNVKAIVTVSRFGDITVHLYLDNQNEQNKKTWQATKLEITLYMSG